jgi:hypothetical protein
MDALDLSLAFRHASSIILNDEEKEGDEGQWLLGLGFLLLLVLVL